MMIAVTDVPQVLEAGMLVCFGVSWPIDILKTLRTRVTAGKSVAFMSMVLLGYCLGLAAKLILAAQPGRTFEPVTAMYALNAVLVAVDIALYMKFSRGEN